jgi:predicted glycogen debranching enzyme
MSESVRSMPWVVEHPTDSESLLTREWLVTNGLGGYASGTVSGVATRRYHGLLIAALPSPLGRMMMFNHLTEQIQLPDGEVLQLSGEERTDQGLEMPGAHYLSVFRLEAGLPVWRYEIKGMVLEKQLYLLHLQNTVHITYRLISGASPVQLALRPSMHFRPHEGSVGEPLQGPYALTIIGDRYEIAGSPELPPLRLMVYEEKPALTVAGDIVKNIFYRIEASRGYDAQGVLWSPGYFTSALSPGRSATLVASTEPWNIVLALTPDEALAAECERRERLLRAAHQKARIGTAAELILAADQFIITPAGRVEDAARAHAAGDEVRTVIAGYHWFTDWGRDTMISLEGLALATGRHIEAGWILRTFAYYVRDGLIPNMFPEGEQHGLYHTADATLWFFHALDRYLAHTHDRETLKLLLPKLRDMVDHHLRGTRFGIHVDPQDGLLCQGERDYQLTWMDAKVGDWVVTPRRGKAVEINALWYNALRLLAGWIHAEQGDEAARALVEHAEQARRSFNERFWYAPGGYLYDVVDGEQGDDSACRPNQVLAISLRYPILEPSRWLSVLEVIRQRLLTPVGLRSLAPGHPDYKPTYDGDLRARDAAYHQGTVWGWLIGPFIDAWLKVYPDDRAGARRFLQGFVPHLGEACIGSISEIFDAEPPFSPRGCIAQGWSVAEALRCWIKTAEEEHEG